MAATGAGVAAWGRQISSSPGVSDSADRTRVVVGTNILLCQQQLPVGSGTHTPAVYTVPAGQTIILKSFHARNTDLVNPHTYWVRLVLSGQSNSVVSEFHSVELAPGAEDLYTNEEVLPSALNIVTYADAANVVNFRANGMSSASQ